MGIEGLSDASSFGEISSLAARTIASSESVNAGRKIFIMYSVVANQTPPSTRDHLGIIHRQLLFGSYEFNKSGRHQLMFEPGFSTLGKRNMAGPKVVTHLITIVRRQIDFDKLLTGVHPLFRVRFVPVLDQAARYVVVVGKRGDAVC